MKTGLTQTARDDGERSEGKKHAARFTRKGGLWAGRVSAGEWCTRRGERMCAEQLYTCRGVDGGDAMEGGGGRRRAAEGGGGWRSICELRCAGGHDLLANGARETRAAHSA